MREGPSRKLSTKMQEKAFLLYFKTNNLTKVADKYDVAWTTIQKLAKRKKWKERRDCIIADAQKDTDTHLTKLHTELVTKSEGLLDAIYTQLLTKGELSEDVEATIADYERIVKLVLKLSGEADKKVEVKIEVAITHLAKLFVIAVNENVRNPGERERVQKAVVGYLSAASPEGNPNGSGSQGIIDITPVD